MKKDDKKAIKIIEDILANKISSDEYERLVCSNGWIERDTDRDGLLHLGLHFFADSDIRKSPLADKDYRDDLRRELIEFTRKRS